MAEQLGSGTVPPVAQVTSLAQEVLHAKGMAKRKKKNKHFSKAPP